MSYKQGKMRAGALRPEPPRLVVTAWPLTFRKGGGMEAESAATGQRPSQSCLCRTPPWTPKGVRFGALLG